MLFHMSRDEVMNKFGDLVVSVWEKTNTVIMTDTDTRIGRFVKSDIILSYDLDGNLAIECERAYKKYYSDDEWAVLSFRAMSDVHEVENAEGIITACTYSSKYIDYIRYKKEWLDWANEVASMQRKY